MFTSQIPEGKKHTKSLFWWQHQCNFFCSALLYRGSHSCTKAATAVQRWQQLYKGGNREQLDWEMAHTVLMARLLSWIQASTTNITLIVSVSVSEVQCRKNIINHGWLNIINFHIWRMIQKRTQRYWFLYKLGLILKTV